YSRSLHSFPTRRSSDLSVVHEDLLDETLHPEQCVGCDHLLGAGWARAHAPDDLALFEWRRVVDDDLHQEPVSLSLGQRVHTLRRSEEHTSELQSLAYLV